MAEVPEQKQEHSSDVKKEEENFAVSEGQISLFEDVNKDAMIDEQIAREKLSEALETEKPKKKRKSIITNLIFLAINLFVLGFIINSCLKETDGISFSEIVETQGSRLWWLLGGVALFFLMFFADSMIFYFLVKQSTGKKKFGTCYKVSAVGKYFDAITPFSVGGQPSQIMNLTRAGISPGIATSIPIIKLIIYNIIYTIILTVFFIFGIPFLPIGTALNELLLILFKIFAAIGIIVTAITSIVFILIGSGKIVGRSFVRGIVKIGYSLRIVKDYRKSYNKIMKQVLEYQSSMAYLKKHKKMLAICIVFVLLDVFAYFSIPFTVVMAFSGIELTSFSSAFALLCICITKFIICQMAAVVVPLPGGTGMMEFSFIAMFGVSSLIGNKYIVLGLLAWRFLTYYFTIIQGFTISTIDSIVRVVKSKKELKLAEASEKENANMSEIQENTNAEISTVETAQNQQETDVKPAENDKKVQ